MTLTATVFLPLILSAAVLGSGRGAALPYELVDCGDVQALEVSWFYDWDLTNPCPSSPAEFVPMLWNVGSAGRLREVVGAGWMLGPNEPNYRGQAIATPSEVTAIWPQLEATGRKLVSPAVSACEHRRDSNCLDPLWLEEFMAACQDCRIDAIALHWYGCDADELATYLDRRAAQFGKPLWLTEWACPNWAGDPVTFMRAALPVVVERTERNAWFASRTNGWRWFDPLVNPMGLTELGAEYVN